MRPLPRLAWVYIGGIAVVSAVLLVALLPVTALGKPEGLVLAAGGILALLVTETHQLPLCHKTKITVSSAVIFASVLLTDMGLAAWIAAIGIGLAYIYLKRKWYNVTFNVAAYALAVFGSGYVYQLVSGGRSGSLSSLTNLAAMLLAGLTYFALNTGLVAGIVALRHEQSWLASWLDICQRCVSEYAAMISLGILAATVYQAGWWALILVVLPLYMVYRSLRTLPKPSLATQ